MATEPTWVVMPVLAGPEMTEAAVSDVLAQSVPVRLLVVNQGVDDAFRDRLERLAEQQEERVLVWSHMPPLPSLSATWNAALDCVWAAGASEALVVNNDVRLHRQTVEYLQKVLQRERALFVSAVGVTADQFAESQQPYTDYDFWDAHSEEPTRAGQLLKRGGPDFSCFLISRACHLFYHFDEGFIPAFCEDCSYHRELMLADEGARIFSVNLPYLHLASGTLKTLNDKAASRIRREIEEVSRAHYVRCWGGPVNAERFTKKYDQSSAREGVTNPELQALVQAGGSVRALIDGAGSSATPDSAGSC